MKNFFKIGAAMSLFVALFHVNKFFFPAGSDAVRHLIFVGINVIVCYGLLKRPNWFIYFVGALTLQQWYSHGSYFIQQWQGFQRIDWASIFVIIGMPIIFIALIKDKK